MRNHTEPRLFAGEKPSSCRLQSCRRLRYTVSYPAFSTTVANAMKSSLLLTGLAQRLLLAAVLLAVIWGVYAWAVAT